jgi:glutamate/tyrosine decarboxylase-like PLP-dependent enzyme
MTLRRLMSYLEKCQLLTDEELAEIEERLTRGDDVLELGVRYVRFDESKNDHVVEVDDLEGLLSENGYDPNFDRYSSEVF